MPKLNIKGAIQAVKAANPFHHEIISSFRFCLLKSRLPVHPVSSYLPVVFFFRAEAHIQLQP
ncbi:MAG: hypothetical protein ACRD63_06905, partial [Pyrinomonadaceae bacterium]